MKDLAHRDLPLNEFGAELAGLARHVHSTGERVVLRESGEPVAVLVSPSDLQCLEALEDRLDALDAFDALADYRSRGGVGFDEVKSDLGL